jgi:hypothetical protein
MEIKNNFVSVIVLGNFNPSILTEDFLKKVCGFNFTAEPKKQLSPVVSEIKYGNINFLADLDRFQIKEDNISEFEKTKIFEYVSRYLEILSYTPILIAGLNFNVTLENVDNDVIEKNIISNKSKLKEILESDEIVMIPYLRYKSEEDKEHVSLDVLFKGSQTDIDILGRFEIKKVKDKTFCLNYNFEVRGLEKNRERISILTGNYPSILNRYKKLLQVIVKN